MHRRALVLVLLEPSSDTFADCANANIYWLRSSQPPSLLHLPLERTECSNLNTLTYCRTWLSFLHTVYTP